MGNCLGQCLAGKSGLRYECDEEEQLVQDEDDGGSFIYKIIKFRKKSPSKFLESFWDRQCQAYARLTKDGIVSESPEIQLQCLDAQTLMLSSRDMPNITAQYKTPGCTEYGFPSSSRASSSLDLEWEHEYGASSNNANTQLSQSWFFIPEQEIPKDPDQDQISNSSITNTVNLISPIATPRADLSTTKLTAENVKNGIIRNASKTSWSHISTPESLEWDIDEEQQQQMIVEDDMLDHETLQLLHEIELLKNKVLEETGSGLDFEVIRRPKDS